MIRAAVALVLTYAGASSAAVWTCPRRTPVAPTSANVLVVYCRATGTYTTGGDPMGGGGANTELCDSENRLPTDVVVSTAASATTGQGYVVAYKPGAILLLTASGTPGQGQALIELAAGTSIEGATFSAFVLCK
jgi:hypothetical protein